MSTGSGTAAHKRRLGEYGEAVAARHLVEAGMVVLDRSWRCSAGEIDLVVVLQSLEAAAEVEHVQGVG